MFAVWVQAPLEHIALQDDGAFELAFDGALAGGSDVHHDPALGPDTVELIGLHPLNAPPGIGEDLVHSPAHRTSSPSRYSSVRTGMRPWRWSGPKKFIVCRAGEYTWTLKVRPGPSFTMSCTYP